MAGSDSFVRTEDFNGPDENEATKAAVHIAITYNEAGEIRCYRNGQRYGRTTKKNGVQSFNGKKSQIVFGMRHGKVGESREGKLRGKVFAARLYDRALSDEEVMASASGGNFVSDEKLLESLSETQREELLSLRKKLAKHEQQLAAMPEPPDANEAWARLAHALFNLKEFIYVK